MLNWNKLKQLKAFLVYIHIICNIIAATHWAGVLKNT